MVIRLIGIVLLLLPSFCLFAKQDSIIYKGKMYYYNTDSLHRKYLKSNYRENFAELERYCFLLFNAMDDVRRLAEFNKIEKLAKELNSEKLFLECNLLRTNFLPHDTERLKVEKEKAFKSLLENAIKEKNNFIYLRGLFMFAVFYQETGQYFRMFKLFEEFAKHLEYTNEDDFPWKKNGYERLAEVYYEFENYEEALYFWKKALGPSLGFYDQSNLRASNGLGLYYRKIGNMKKSDSYFKSILENKDEVNCHSWHKAFAAYNLGINKKEQKYYKEAISLFEKAISFLPETNQSFKEKELILLSMTGLGECYLVENRMEEAYSIFVRINTEISDEDINIYSPQIYRFLSKYYITNYDSLTAINYLDSAFNSQDDYRLVFNPSPLLMARQEAYFTQLEQQEREREYYIRGLFAASFFIIICLITITILIHVYRRIKEAYNELIQKNLSWTDSLWETEECIKIESLDEEDRKLMQQIEYLMTQEKIYKNENLTLDILANQLHTHRNTISKVINQITNKKFNRFINEYRVKEALQILSSAENSISLEWLMEEVGFRSRNPFFETFKSMTGLTPGAFIKQKERTKK